MSSLEKINDALRDLYYPPLTEFLDSNIEDYQQKGPSVPAAWYHERGLPLPWVYVPPVWYKRALHWLRRRLL